MFARLVRLILTTVQLANGATGLISFTGPRTCPKAVSL
jgi:hypothetical protein